MAQLIDVDLLETARDVIADPRHWTKGAIARNEHERTVDPNCDDAQCWCALGAIAKATPEDYEAECRLITRVQNALWGMYEEWIGRPLADFNDAAGVAHGAVICVFDRAIADARKEAQ